MQTAMQELLNELDLIKIVDKNNFFMVKYIIEKSIEKEKEQIMNNYIEGVNAHVSYCNGKVFISKEEYYNQTYNKNI